MIYFIQEDDTFRNRVKIGYTEDMSTLKKRIRSFYTSSPSPLILLFVIPGSKADEAIMHERFKKYRLHGEWFRFGINLRIFVMANRHKFYSPDMLEKTYETIDDGDIEIVDEYVNPQLREPTDYEKEVISAFEKVENEDRPSWNKIHKLIIGRDVNINKTQADKYKMIIKKFGIQPRYLSP